MYRCIKETGTVRHCMIDRAEKIGSRRVGVEGRILMRHAAQNLRNSFRLVQAAEHVVRMTVWWFSTNSYAPTSSNFA
jgi:hypothetical protein